MSNLEDSNGFLKEMAWLAIFCNQNSIPLLRPKSVDLLQNWYLEIFGKVENEWGSSIGDVMILYLIPQKVDIIYQNNLYLAIIIIHTIPVP